MTAIPIIIYINILSTHRKPQIKHPSKRKKATEITALIAKRATSPETNLYGLNENTKIGRIPVASLISPIRLSLSGVSTKKVNANSTIVRNSKTQGAYSGILLIRPESMDILTSSSSTA